MYNMWRTLATYLLHISILKTQRQVYLLFYINNPTAHLLLCKVAVNSACHVISCFCNNPAAPAVLPFYLTSASSSFTSLELMELTGSSICGTDWCPNSTSEQRSGSVFSNPHTLQWRGGWRGRRNSFRESLREVYTFYRVFQNDPYQSQCIDVWSVHELLFLK